MARSGIQPGWLSPVELPGAFTTILRSIAFETLSPFTSTGQELVESAQDGRPEYPTRSLDPTQGRYLGLSDADSATGSSEPSTGCGERFENTERHSNRGVNALNDH